MIDLVKRAHQANAANLLEVAKAALSRIEIAQLDPNDRIGVRQADDMLSRVLKPIRASLDEAAPESDVR